VHVDAAKISADYLVAGRTLMSADYFSCFSCHQQGDKKPEGPEEGWAPDLGMASERLNPTWWPFIRTLHVSRSRPGCPSR
jgi:mono/diheme cytochrome c family protein